MTKRKKKSRRLKVRAGSKTLIIGEKTERITGSCNISLLQAFQDYIDDIGISRSEGIRLALAGLIKYKLPKYRKKINPKRYSHDSKNG